MESKTSRQIDRQRDREKLYLCERMSRDRHYSRPVPIQGGNNISFSKVSVILDIYNAGQLHVLSASSDILNF